MPCIEDTSPTPMALSGLEGSSVWLSIPLAVLITAQLSYLWILRCLVTGGNHHTEFTESRTTFYLLQQILDVILYVFIQTNTLCQNILFLRTSQEILATEGKWHFFISYNTHNMTFKHNKCYSVACKSQKVNENTYLFCKKRKEEGRESSTERSTLT